ncbi:MAG: GNAT family N-acetyltransferase [Anaerolineae bacterium]|nr:GNAT family N-acetyltransferase [Anaerolineae bacterium]
MLTVRCLTTLEEFSNLRESWRDLLATSELKTTFLTWEWLYSWWQTFGGDHALQLITVWRGEQLAGIAPLMLTQKNKWGLKLRLLTNIAYHDPDISGFIVANGDDEALGALCRAIRQKSKEWQVFELAETPAAQIIRILQLGCFSKSDYFIRIENNLHLYIPIETDWETYFGSQSKNLKQGTKRKLGRIEKEGKKLDFRRYTGTNVTPKNLEDIFSINQYGNFPETYQTQKQREFHYQLLEKMREPGYMDISFLDLDEMPIAFRYGFTFHGCYEDWRLGFDSRYSDYSPGTLLLYYLMRDNFQRGLSGIDLLRGLEEYKRRWIVQERNYLHLYILHRKDLITSLLLIWAPKVKDRLLSLLMGVKNAFGKAR